MKKNKKKLFKSALSRKIVTTCLSSFFVCAFSSVIAFVLAKKSFPSYILFIILLTSFAMILFIFILSYREIIATSEKIETAVAEIEKHNTDDILDLHASKENITDALSKILERIKESISREYLIEVLQQRSAFSELQSQINPHFLYNILESIRGQALVDGNETIAEMIETLAKYFRYSISKNSNENMVTLEKELENAKNYIKIQKYRFEDRFDFQIKYRCDETECFDCKIPKMTLQPIVENAILHGLESRESCGLIQINIEITDQRLLVQISDNGKGIDRETLIKIDEKLKNPNKFFESDSFSKSNGIALTNVNERLKLAFGNEYGIMVSSTFGIGTEITLCLPIIK